MKEIEKKLICEIGCGENKVFFNSIGVDIRKTKKTDVIADARKLPFKDGCFDQIYSSHAIEHFSHVEVESVLIEWIRCLKEEGGFELRCPDLRARALIFFLRPSWDNIKNIYGEQNYNGNYHSCGFTYNLIKEKLEMNGITNVRRILDGYKCIPFIPCDLHIKGIKHRISHSEAVE
ncbi:MAG: class I SAM-dependent methyltransferase [Methanothrix sp.]|jgi:predicted SAM-dependent methyltransferase|nr:class I SAM-dependent methyltransferase [Methanothrix sp.]